jgi:hypothetical protein
MGEQQEQQQHSSPPLFQDQIKVVKSIVCNFKERVLCALRAPLVYSSVTFQVKIGAQPFFVVHGSLPIVCTQWRVRPSVPTKVRESRDSPFKIFGHVNSALGLYL